MQLKEPVYFPAQGKIKDRITEVLFPLHQENIWHRNSDAGYTDGRCSD